MSDDIEKIVDEFLRSDYTEIVHNERQVHVLDNCDGETRVMDEHLLVGDGHQDSAFQTDDEHRWQQEEDAYVGPSGERLDELDQKIMLRRMQKEEAAKESPHACPNPASWDSGILGGFVRALPNQGTAREGLTQRIITWLGETRECLPVTISLNPPKLPNAASNLGLVRPFARIRWGTHSGVMEAEVDIGTGVQIVLAASSIEVDVGLDGGSDTACDLTGALAFYAAVKATFATRTAYVGTVNFGATTAAQQRPQFAVVIADVMRSDVTVPFTLNLLDANTNVIGQVTVAASSTIAVPIPLPNDCRAVTIANTDADTNAVFRIVWGLSF